MSQINLSKTSKNQEFLQSEEWRKFQEATGKRTFHIERGGFWANVIEHKLPIVGKYFYVPRWPSARIFNFQFSILNELFKLAKREKIGWIRIEPENEEALKLIKKNADFRIVKAPHDMQPKEILMLDITKSEEELLSEMKQKARYNIRLATKKNIKITSYQSSVIDNKHIDEFINLVKITAQRDNITPHPDDYYRKMFETIPRNILKLYIAEYDDKLIAANLMIFYGETATYLHGASDNEYRNLMAPYLLQWQAIKDAKAVEFKTYDLGGINTKNQELKTNNWSGITRFKTGFAPDINPFEFPGSYDIVLNPAKYYLYKAMQGIKRLIK